MALKEIINRIIEKYGVDAVLRSYTTTTNDYGEEVSSSFTDTNIKVVLFSNISDDYLRKVLGFSQQGSESFLVAHNVDVDEKDILIVDGKEYEILRVDKIIYMGLVVAKILVVA